MKRSYGCYFSGHVLDVTCSNNIRYCCRTHRRTERHLVVRPAWNYMVAPYSPLPIVIEMITVQKPVSKWGTIERPDHKLSHKINTCPPPQIKFTYISTFGAIELKAYLKRQLQSGLCGGWAIGQWYTYHGLNLIPRMSRNSRQIKSYLKINFASINQCLSGQQSRCPDAFHTQW